MTTTTPAIATPIEELVAQLKSRLDAMGDGQDARSDREKSAYRRHYDSIQRTISGLSNAPDDLAREQSFLDGLTATRAVVCAKQQEIVDALESAPDWHKFTDHRERDRAFDHEQHLRDQKDLLARGLLLESPGVPYPRLDVLDSQIESRTNRRDRAHRALDGFLQQAEALLAP